VGCRLGVVGTLVWDTIHRRDVREAPVEEWGGIGYALESLVASLPAGWEIVPLVKIGADLAEPAGRYLSTLPGVIPGPGVRTVPEANNRVELNYSEGIRRSERLSGGVPPWAPGELPPLVSGCDALYVNFISGFEMTLESALELRDHFQGPIWADLHSLFLGVDEEGLRIPKPLNRWSEWFRAFDAVQVNEDEFRLLGSGGGDPWTLAARAVGRDLRLLAVTLGERGSACVVEEALPADPFRWARERPALAPNRPARSFRVEAEAVEEATDSTGCGDVWGSTTFARLLAGDSLEEALAQGNRMAARNVTHRGARGLHHHLTGGIAPGSEP